MGSAIEEGDSEPLAGADGDVDPELAGGLQDAQGQQVGGADCQGLGKYIRCRIHKKLNCFRLHSSQIAELELVAQIF